jgi:GTP-binding protein
MRTHTARFLAGAADPARFPKLGLPEIAFAGRSNVGKSSLLNRLIGRRGLARVSKTPGRTQQLNFFVIDERLTFVDLPGYGFARVPVAVRTRWQRLVESYLGRRAHLRAVVVIIDLRRGLERDDVQLYEYLSAHRVPAILVATKSDKLGHGERKRRAQVLAEAAIAGVAGVVVCSAQTGEGIQQLWKQIETWTSDSGSLNADS